jgi:staphyloferrin B biosynthesis citrate synthase
MMKETERGRYPLNPVIDRMRNGSPALGMVVRLTRTGDIVRIARASGHDFVFIDTQHSLFGIQSLGHIAQSALGSDVAAIVRARSVDDPNVPSLLDNCVSGIVFPDVNSASTARRAVERCKFPPVGKRSVAGGYPQFDYRSVPVADSTAFLNETTLVVCMIETVEAVSNLAEIADVEGVDVIHVGCGDLLLDMGRPGEYEDPEFRNTVEHVIATAIGHGKFAGVGGNRDIDQQKAFIKQGALFFTTHSDMGFMISAAAEWTRTLRDGSETNRNERDG